MQCRHWAILRRASAPRPVTTRRRARASQSQPGFDLPASPVVQQRPRAPGRVAAGQGRGGAGGGGNLYTLWQIVPICKSLVPTVPLLPARGSLAAEQKLNFLTENIHSCTGPLTLGPNAIHLRKFVMMLSQCAKTANNEPPFIICHEQRLVSLQKFYSDYNG